MIDPAVGIPVPAQHTEAVMSEHVSRWSRRIVAGLMSMALAVGGVSTHVAAQEAPTTAVVPIAAVGTDGLAGLALLMPAPGGGTNVQIVVSDAPSGTFAVVHGGTCAAIDPAPVALLGDVSTTSQVAIANAIDTLADGAHVLALHAGLDLASALGCGAIPRVAGSAPAPTPEPGPTQPSGAGGSFTGPVTGFSITWPADWERYEVVESETEDRIGLRHGTTSILIGIRPRPGIDAQTCVRDARQGLFDRLDQGTLRDLAPLADADGSPISGIDGDRAWLAYRYVSVEAGGEFDIADYLECRTSGDYLLSILHRSTPDTYDAAEREAVLAGMTLPGGEPQATPVAGGGSYAAPTLGFSIAWDGRWMEIPVTGLEGYEHVGLSDGPSRVVVSGILDPAWNALACAQDSDANFVVRESAGTYVDLEPLMGPDGSRIRGGDETRAWVGYRYTVAETGGTVAEYHECRAANGVVVRIQHRSLPDLYDQEAVARDQLLEGLTMPSGPPPPPASTPNAACEGYAPWHEGTVGRVEELARLKSEVNEATNDAALSFSLTKFKQVLRRVTADLSRMHLDQRAAVAPPAAAEAHARAIEMFAAFQKAAAVLSEYYETSTDRPTLDRATAAQKAADASESAYNDAIVVVEAACA